MGRDGTESLSINTVKARVIRAAWLAGTLFVAGASSVVRGEDPAPSRSRDTEVVIGITAPARVATLASVLPARISQVLAAEGSMVEAGDVVVALEDDVQRARTEVAKAAAQSTLEIAVARARWEKARRELDRLRRLHGGENASSKELDDALSEAEITRLEYELAGFNQKQAQRACELEQANLEQFSIRAPFRGYVAEHLRHAGETIDQLEGVLTLVQVDPLLVLTDCGLGLAPAVRVGDKVAVRPVDTPQPPRTGTVVLASRVADGASQTFKVKIRVDNADASWMAGLKVAVEFPVQTATGTTTDARAPGQVGRHKPRREEHPAGHPTEPWG
jgi:RND family efflux transporter MFP subunit